MKVTVAEYASVNADGTFTVVRGGIDIWKAPGFPLDVAGSLLIEVPGGTLPAGLSEMKVSVRDASEVVVFELSGMAQIAKPEGVLRAVIHYGGRVTSAGPMVFRANIGVETGQMVVNVVAELGA